MYRGSMSYTLYVYLLYLMQRLYICPILYRGSICTSYVEVYSATLCIEALYPIYTSMSCVHDAFPSAILHVAVLSGVN